MSRIIKYIDNAIKESTEAIKIRTGNKQFDNGFNVASRLAIELLNNIKGLMQEKAENKAYVFIRSNGINAVVSRVFASEHAAQCAMDEDLDEFFNDNEDILAALDRYAPPNDCDYKVEFDHTMVGHLDYGHDMLWQVFQLVTDVEGDTLPPHIRNNLEDCRQSKGLTI